MCYTDDMLNMARTCKKAEQNLQSRIDAFEAPGQTKGARPLTGGYHRPGSQNRHKG